MTRSILFDVIGGDAVANGMSPKSQFGRVVLDVAVATATDCAVMKSATASPVCAVKAMDAVAGIVPCHSSSRQVIF